MQQKLSGIRRSLAMAMPLLAAPAWGHPGHGPETIGAAELLHTLLDPGHGAAVLGALLVAGVALGLAARRRASGSWR